MPVIIGSYGLTVDSASSVWVEGPIVRPGEKVRIQASGSPIYAADVFTRKRLASTDATSPPDVSGLSYPTGFSSDVLAGDNSAGDTSTYNQAACAPTHWCSLAHVIHFKAGDARPVTSVEFTWLTQVGGSAPTGRQAHLYSSPDGSTWNLIADYLASADSTWQHVTQAVSTADQYFLLWVTGQGVFIGPGDPDNESDLIQVGDFRGYDALGYECANRNLYEEAEGTYGEPGYFAPGHAFAPSSCLGYVGVGLSASLFEISNTVPYGLGMVVREDGMGPPAGFNQTGFRPERDTTYDWSDFPLGGNPNRVNRLWFIQNDTSAGFSDNSGSFTLTLTRYAGTSMQTTNPQVSLIKPQVGIEASYGANQAATRILGNVLNGEFTITPEQTKQVTGITGVAGPTRSTLTKELSKGSIKAIADYADIGYIFQSVEGVAAKLMVTTGVYKHTWTPPIYSGAAYQSYTVEFPAAAGDRVNKVNGLIFVDYKLETEGDKQLQFSANFQAKKIQDVDSAGADIVASTGVNDVQTLTVNGGPTGGSFDLDLDGQRVTVVWTAIYAASALQTLIRARGGDWATATVSGSAGGPYTITNPLGIPKQAISPIYTDPTGANTFVGGMAPTATNVHTTMGGMKIHPSFEIQPASIAGQAVAYMSWADTLADLDNAPTTPVFLYKADVEVSARTDLQYRLSPTDVGPAFPATKKADEQKASMTFTMGYTDEVKDFIAKSKQSGNVGIYFRMSLVGPEIASSGYNRTLEFDYFCTPMWKGNASFGTDLRVIELEMQNMIDLDGVFWRRTSLITDVADFAAN